MKAGVAALALLLAAACTGAGDRPAAPARFAVRFAALQPCTGPDGSACDDKEPCTSGETCQKGQCTPAKTAPDGSSCKDDLACTLNTLCDKGQCKPTPAGNACDCWSGTDAECAAWKLQKIDFGEPNACSGVAKCDPATKNCIIDPATVVQCPGGGACASSTCNPATGKCESKPKNENKLCDDGDPCTANDVCHAGVCKPGSVFLCACKVDADCAQKEDGDQCNGTLVCQQNQCVVDPKTVVACDKAKDGPCERNVCAPKTGQCQMLPADQVKKKDPKCQPTLSTMLSTCELAPLGPFDPKPGVIVCDDGEPCTASSSCTGAKCTSEPTAFICECLADADCAKKEDGDLCNGTFQCDKSKVPYKCQVDPKTVVTCDASGDTACKKNTCDKPTGKCAPKVVPGQFVLCDDGNPCTASDTCDAGKCVPGTYICQCEWDADCAKKEDGDPCNGTLQCNKSKGAPYLCEVDPKTVVTCDKSQDSECQVAKCSKDTGKCAMVQTWKPGACDDGNPCTNDGCGSDGACKHTAQPWGTACGLQMGCQAGLCVPM